MHICTNGKDSLGYSPLARARSPQNGSVDGPPKILPRLTKVGKMNKRVFLGAGH